jgi:hypothetical protein
MQDDKTRFGKLTVNYASDDDNIHCVCECGTRIIVSKSQLTDNSSCGCIHRKILLALSGMVDDGGAFDGSAFDRSVFGRSTSRSKQMIEHQEGRVINFDSKKDKWRARITYQSKEYHLGYFADKETAVATRKEAESNLSGNFIEWLSGFKNKTTGIEMQE